MARTISSGSVNAGATPLNPLIVRTRALDGAHGLLIRSDGSRRKAENETILARARKNGIPLIDANVGMNLIVSQGEIVAYKWGNDQINTAEIAGPLPPSRAVARQGEAAYLAEQGPEMARRYEQTIQRRKGESR